MDLLSVIVPVYNVESYLEECLNSIINQTYSNLQIILVDDGSTDSSGKICDQYADKNSRIVVVHQKNAGAGAAKNTGLELIEGTYFSIIDSDDYIDTHMYEIMIDRMKQNNSDIAQCLVCNKYISTVVDEKYVFSGNRTLSRDKYLTELLDDWKYAIFANKVFKTNLLKDIRFPIGRKIDDEFFTYKLVCNARKVTNIKDILYYYRMRKSSVMNNSNNDRLLFDRAECFIERYEYIKNLHLKVTEEYYFRLSDSLLWMHNQVTDVEIKQKLLEFMKRYPYQKRGIISRLVRKLTKKDILNSNEKRVFKTDDFYI